MANPVEGRLPARGSEVVEPAGPEPEFEPGMHVRRDEQRGFVERWLDGWVTDERNESGRRIHAPTV